MGRAPRAGARSRPRGGRPRRRHRARRRVGGQPLPGPHRLLLTALSVVTDDEHPTWRTLVLDDLRHSVVDLDKPTYLEVPVHPPPRRRHRRRRAGRPAALFVHVGGGGFTLPRLLRATRPGSEQLVLEIDGDSSSSSSVKLGFRAGLTWRSRSVAVTAVWASPPAPTPARLT